MFTGIIEKTAKVIKLVKKNVEFELTIGNPFIEQIKSGESIAVDGVCLTVEKISNDSLTFFVSKATVEKTIITRYLSGTIVNIERALKADGRFDGHIVQGHVDTTGVIANFKKIGEGIEIIVKFDTKYSQYLVSRGSVAVNGISLTCSETGLDSAVISIIPETIKRTSFSKNLNKGQIINIEFDIIGKYVEKMVLRQRGMSNLESLIDKL